jgi:acyl-CoA-binding protein
MTLEERFADAQVRVKTLRAKPSTPDLLSLYALYKQASEGDATGKRPGAFDIKGRAKYDAWDGVRGVAKERAMGDYVALVERLLGEQR